MAGDFEPFSSPPGESRQICGTPHSNFLGGHCLKLPQHLRTGPRSSAENLVDGEAVVFPQMPAAHAPIDQQELPCFAGLE